MRFGGLCLAEGFCEPVAAFQSPDHALGARCQLHRRQRLDLWSRHQLLQEPAHHLLVQQPLVVFGKGGGVPDRIVRAQADKPPVKQVVVQLLQ